MSFLARTDGRIVTDKARNIPLSLHWMQEINSRLPTTALLQGTQEWVVAYNICQNKVWGHCLEKMHRQNPCHWILAGADNGTIENNVGAHETVSYTREEMRCPLPLQPLFTRADCCPIAPDSSLGMPLVDGTKYLHRQSPVATLLKWAYGTVARDNIWPHWSEISCPQKAQRPLPLKALLQRTDCSIETDDIQLNQSATHIKKQAWNHLPLRRFCPGAHCRITAYDVSCECFSDSGKKLYSASPLQTFLAGTDGCIVANDTLRNIICTHCCEWVKCIFPQRVTKSCNFAAHRAGMSLIANPFKSETTILAVF